MSEKSTFHETKEVVSRLREPLKIKFVPYRYQTKEKQEHGHYLQLEMNINWGEIDTMRGELEAMIQNAKEIIEGPLHSKYLGRFEDE